MSDNQEFGAFFAGLMVGGLIGAAVALLTAPQSGEDTRTLLRDRGIELKDKAVEVGQDVQTRTSKALEDTVARLDATVADLRVRVDEVSRSISTKTKGAATPPTPPAA
jgi:gas vesicle protein